MAIAEELIKRQKNIFLSKDNIVTLNVGPIPTFGVFFDGTKNNQINDKQSDGNDNSPSNISKLWELYKYQGIFGKHYEHGVGSTTGEENSDIDAAIAWSFGRHLQNGIDELSRFLEKHKNANKAIIDVFGFSRGAACARAFINEVLRSTQLDPKFWGGPIPEFRFAGLFDTVGSIGIPGNDTYSYAIYQLNKHLTGPVILDVHEKAVKKLVHITAGDEIREFFPLTSVKTKNAIPSNFIEEEWPGAHSDIGGGYGTRPQTLFFDRINSLHTYETLTYAQKVDLLAEARRKTEQKFPDKGRLRGRKFTYIFEKGDSIAEEDYDENHETNVLPIWKRKTINEICNMTLERMHFLALENGVPFAPLTDLDDVKGEIEYELQYDDLGEPILDKEGKHVDKMLTELVAKKDITNNEIIDKNGNVVMVRQPKRLKTPYKVTKILRRLMAGVKNNGRDSPEFDVLFRRYIHISDLVAKENFDDTVNPHPAESNPTITAPNGLREMFYNSPADAIDPDKYEFFKSWDYDEENEAF